MIDCDKLYIAGRGPAPRERGPAMKTSIRLMLTALLVSGITFAAAGAPLPAQVEPAKAQPAAELAALSFSPQ